MEMIKIGYTTEFQNSFRLSAKLHPKLQDFLVRFSQTRRMKRNLPEELYGTEGEFFCEDTENAGEDKTSDVIDQNEPPKTQPGLYCQWTPDEDGKTIGWDGGEKFDDYEEWLKYLIDKILEPNGYKLNGHVYWRGEDMLDIGTIVVRDNKIEMISGKFN